MSATTQSLREVLAANRDLRQKVQKAMALAAYKAVTDAGITVTATDIADAQEDIAALTGSSGKKGDETNAVIVGVAIGAITGF
jgi:hypothetical protein